MHTKYRKNKIKIRKEKSKNEKERKHRSERTTLVVFKNF